MKLIGNLIWFFGYGLWFALLHFVLGLALCLSIIFIPFGVMHFKIMKYAVSPFGHDVYSDFDYRPMMNLLWIVFGGYLLPAVHIVVGIVLCITIVGIPFGKKCFKLAKLEFNPFGAFIVRNRNH